MPFSADEAAPALSSALALSHPPSYPITLIFLRSAVVATSTAESTCRAVYLLCQPTQPVHTPTHTRIHTRAYLQAFEKTHGVKLGFMSAFICAAASTLKEMPVINAVIDGGDVRCRH